MAKIKLKDILIDADVVSHFITGGQILILHKIFSNKILMLDKVYDELLKFNAKKLAVENLINLGIVTKVPFPSNNHAILKEYLHIKKLMFKGDGESACLAYVKHTKDIIGSSNLKDVKRYCALHSIELLTTMDFLCEAFRIGLLTESNCDEFISSVLAAGSKLPVTKMSEYNCK